jgi:hypothetical protein
LTNFAAPDDGVLAWVDDGAGFEADGVGLVADGAGAGLVAAGGEAAGGVWGVPSAAAEPIIRLVSAVVIMSFFNM